MPKSVALFHELYFEQDSLKQSPFVKIGICFLLDLNFSFVADLHTSLHNFLLLFVLLYHAGPVFCTMV